MGPDDASVVRNLADPGFVPAPIGTHHVPDGRPAQPIGVVAVGACEPGRVSPSDATRGSDPAYVPPPPLRDAPEQLAGEVSVGANEPGVRSPSQVTRERAS